MSEILWIHRYIQYQATIDLILVPISVEHFFEIGVWRSIRLRIFPYQPSIDGILMQKNIYKRIKQSRVASNGLSPKISIRWCRLRIKIQATILTHTAVEIVMKSTIILWRMDRKRRLTMSLLTWRHFSEIFTKRSVRTLWWISSVVRKRPTA